MPVSNVQSYYLGQGLAAARPDGSLFGSPDIGFYYATDTGVLSFWTGSTWGDFTAAGLAFLAAGTAGNQLTALGVSAFVQTILNDADAAAVRTTIGAGTGTGDLVAANNLSDVASVPTALGNLLGAVISPAQITSNENDYNPASLSTATKLRLSTDASRDVTGLQGGSAGRVLCIHNVGAFDLVLKDESGSSTAGNRFAFDGDLTLAADTSAILAYDGTSSRWRLLARGRATNGLTSGDVTTALGYTPLKAGKVSYPIAASAMVARTTNGAATGSAETTTNKVMTATLDFDQSTDEFAQVAIPMPKNWNEGTITAQFYWTATTTGNVVWGVQGVALSDDDALDTAFGTAVTVTDAVTAAGDLMVSAETSAVTIAGTPAAGDLAVFQFYRDADNGSDTLAADAKLIAVKLFITLDAADEA